MPSAASVFGPTTPSTVRPLRRWKRRTAARVRGPLTPSAATPSFCCTARSVSLALALDELDDDGVESWASAPPAATLDRRDGDEHPGAAAEARGGGGAPA